MSTPIKLSDRDLRLLAQGIQCLKDPNGLQIDYKKLAELAGFKSSASANASFLCVKRKLLNSAYEVSKATPKSGAAKDKANANNDEQDEGDKDVTPKAPAKKRSTKVKVEAEEVEAAQGDDEQTPSSSPKKKGARKSKTNGSAMKGPDTDQEGAGNDTPAPKAKRVYKRKPKDENAPPAKRAKKSATPAAEIPAKVNEDEQAVKTELKAEDEEHEDGDISDDGGEQGTQEEEDRVFDEDEQKIADDKLFGITA